MPAADTDEQRMEDEEIPDTVLTVMSAVSAVGIFLVLTALGWIALDDITYGAVAGVIGGTGSWLFTPWLLKAQTEAGEDGDFAAAARSIDESTKLGVTGIGLEVGGILMIVTGIVLQEPTLQVGIAVGLFPGALAYVVGSVLFNF